MCSECNEDLKKYRFNSRDNGYETGLSRDERYILNKIHSEYIQKTYNFQTLAESPSSTP